MKQKMKILMTLISGCYLGLFSGCSDEQAKELVEDNPVVELMKAAESGDAEAQGILGCRYMLGDGVEQNEVEGAKWLLVAAEQGDALAVSKLPLCYFVENPVIDKARVLNVWRKRAEQGDAWALKNLALCYSIGDGVPMDKEKAVSIYLKVAKQGDSLAQNILACLYFSGEGVAVNKEEAVYWWRKAAEQGLDLAQKSLGKCYLNGDGVVQDKAESVKWLQKATAQGNAEAKETLRSIYEISP